MSRPLIALTVYCAGFLINGEKTPCIPSLVPVVQLAQPGKLLGRMVERSGALEPSLISRDRTGKRPALARGLMMSKVAPSSPMMIVFINFGFWILDFRFLDSNLITDDAAALIRNPKSKIQ